MGSPPQPSLSQKERALIEAARREAAERRAAVAVRPGETPPPVTAPGASSGAAQADNTPVAAASATTPPAPPPPSAPSRPAEAQLPIHERIAMLMAREHAEKARREKLYARWKYAAVGVLAALVLWWGMTILSHIRH